MNKKHTDVKYTNRDFDGLKTNLMNFAKTYFPNSYSDFSTSTPGMMFIEMAAYVGDVLSFYLDRNIKENLLLNASERKNLFKLAQAFGYVPSTTGIATTEADMYMVVPAKLVGDIYEPNYSYALNIKPGVKFFTNVTGGDEIVFRTRDYIIFNSYDNMYEKPTVTIYESDIDNNPTYFLLKKKIRLYSEDTITYNISTPSTPEKYYKIQLPRQDISNIISIVDSDGNNWYEVPFLAQDMIAIDDPVENYQDYSGSEHIAPYLLKLKRTSRRYIVRVNENYYTEIQFGAGVTREPDELIVPNPNNVGSSLPEGISRLDTSIDPSNLMYTKTYGRVPYDTTLTITYAYGGGIKSNISQGELTTSPSSIEFDDEPLGLNSSIVTDVQNSIYISNQKAATGGRGGETSDEIRENTLAFFSAQNRAVTKEDYITRVYAMPMKYGSIAKAYITQDSVLNVRGEEILNPCALNLNVLGFDSNKNLTTLDSLIKLNLKQYISQYRLLTDAINIVNAYIINIGVKFEITTYNKENKKEVLYKCIENLKQYFNIDKWQINQPIIINEIYNILAEVDGVRLVNNVNIINKYSLSEGYSGNLYDIESAKKDGVIYPALDPSIFEIKYPNRNIVGKAN